jgi:hypothetical protein
MAFWSATSYLVLKVQRAATVKIEKTQHIEPKVIMRIRPALGEKIMINL